MSPIVEMCSSKLAQKFSSSKIRCLPIETPPPSDDVGDYQEPLLSVVNASRFRLLFIWFYFQSFVFIYRIFFICFSGLSPHSRTLPHLTPPLRLPPPTNPSTLAPDPAGPEELEVKPQMRFGS